MSENKGPILYVLVIGFHHKKGCQVEYSFPPLVPGSPNECPPGWKYLPTLALPDGAHNYDEDTVYFHLPSLAKPKSTIFGISCFRQIPVEKLKNLTADITRGTVQKSVCVLSELPLYGHIQVKMALITHAYFDEGDFSKVSLLEDTYHHLNSVLLQNESPSQIFVGLSPRDFILHWKHKALLLFKLMLLEKRVVFYKSPVHPLCTTILTLLSLHPDMISKGLKQSSCLKLSRPMSPMPNFSDDDYSPEISPKHLPKSNKTNSSGKTNSINVSTDDNNIVPSSLDNNQIDNIEECHSNCDITCLNGDENKTEIGIEISECVDVKKENDEKNGLNRDSSSDTISDSNLHCNFIQLAQIRSELCGFPLSIFKQGYLCLPYLSLPYMDLLSDVNVRGYMVGATNILFKQKRQLYDILVDIDAGRIECQDIELRKQLHLTTEDLRFADYIVKHVSEEKHDVFLDGVGWEGGDEWIRTQFKIYLLSLLRTSLLQDGSREIEHYNTAYVASWKDSFNYKMWNCSDSPTILDINPGHPFAGQLSVSDMKLRLSHTMQNTESGRKINQAMASTGRAVASTSKVFGGAISQAKGALSSWWSNLLVSPDPAQKGIDCLIDNKNNSSAITTATTEDINNDDVIVSSTVNDSDIETKNTKAIDDTYKIGEVNTV